jgi:glyoxylase-like metal-dependent hydrolase (beta-lactamase superfamily II)
VDRQRELLQVVLAAQPGGGLAHLLHGRQQQPDQDRDDRDHDEQLDEGERPAGGGREPPGAGSVGVSVRHGTSGVMFGCAAQSNRGAAAGGAPFRRVSAPRTRVVGRPVPARGHGVPAGAAVEPWGAPGMMNGHSGRAAMVQRKYLFPGVIELNLQAGQSFGVNLYLIDGGTEWALIDVGLEDTLDDVIELIRRLDFPLARCKLLIATHADADHVQALKRARDRLKAKTGAHPAAAKALEAGDAVETYASIPAQDLHLPGGMPACKIDVKLTEGTEIKVGKLALQVWHTPGHTPGQLSFKLGDLLFSGDNIYKDGCVGAIDAHHGSHLPSFIKSLTRIRDDDAAYLLPSHGPVFRKDPAIVQNAIDRLTKYQHMADFGTCTVSWPLEDEWKRDIAAGKMPEL